MSLTNYTTIIKGYLKKNMSYVVNGDSEVVNAQNNDFYCFLERNDSCVMCDSFFGCGRPTILIDNTCQTAWTMFSG
jgi:hypothetical protein